MKQVKIFSLLLSLILMVTSCVKDDGNYNYKDISEAGTIAIPGISEGTKILCKTGDELKLNPSINWLNGGVDDDFSYEWSLITKNPVMNDDNTYDSKIVIGNSKNLDYSVVALPGEYNLIFKTENKATGVTSFFTADFEVAITRGMMFLSQGTDLQYDIHVLSSKDLITDLQDSQVGMSRNYFSTVNGKKIDDAKFITQRNNVNYSNVFVFGESSAYKLDSRTFQIENDDFSTLFTTAPATIKPQAHCYDSPLYGRTEILINNGSIHVIKWNMMGERGIFPSPLTGAFGASLIVDPYIAKIPFVAGNTNSAICYDSRTYGAFVSINTGGSFGNIMTTAPFMSSVINLPGSGTQFKLKYMDNAKDGTTAALFKDEAAADNLWLFRGDYRTSTAVALEKTDISSWTDILNAKYYDFGIRGDYMFYATDNKVYTAKLDGSSQSELFQIGSGENVTCMKIFEYTPNTVYNGRLVFVSTYNESSQKGSVYKAVIDEISGNLEAGSEVEKYEDMGKVIDMFIKN